WGEAEIDGHRHYAANDENPLSCNHRFVGQYYDEESGLHYNRFRYYSPETGQYISHDPIGLLGGFNPYGYVGIPTSFVDPLGLASCSKNFGSRREALRAAKRDAGIPMSQQPDDIKSVPMTDRNGKQIFDSNHQPINTREYHYTTPNGEKIVFQEHSAGHKYGPEGTPGNQGPHFNPRMYDPKTGNGSRNESFPGLPEHYNF
ncbi:RHS repeat-associated core domain-containing protein, partial [Pasteurellaceae bacterium LIM206]|nr:RHS repeat-associated core domain-containing protein [Pasteurellaceae bacterium LIM206]